MTNDTYLLSTDEFLLKVEKTSNYKIDNFVDEIVRAVMSGDCVSIAKINLFLIDNKIKLSDYDFTEKFYNRIFWIKLRKGRNPNCLYQGSPLTKENIEEIKNTYRDLFIYKKLNKL